MGRATAVIGLLPTCQTAGWFAPIVLLLIRVRQGLALGGEYRGAAVYVAEHVPDNKRGFYTSFTQITAILGLFVSLTREQFADWGWRVPFLLSVILVSISLYIRLRMRESPIFSRIKASGMTSAKPLTQAFTVWPNLTRVLTSLFGATAGQGVICYTAQFYALFYLQAILKVNPKTSNIIVAVALLLGMPFFTLFGALSHRIGEKWLMMPACLLYIVSYIPIYSRCKSPQETMLSPYDRQPTRSRAPLASLPSPSTPPVNKRRSPRESAITRSRFLITSAMISVEACCR
jgi:MFS family permease